ncbi:MAG: hypothetical protein FJ253_02005, partial [Phycisphaerae bacterium]|nr:hypothetical protein [Phycisphaerae bacterium]
GAALFAAGWFTNAGGVRALRVSRWNGSAWSALGTGLNGTVRAMAIFDDGLGGGPALFVGGDFTSAGNVSTNNIAKWDGTQWSALGNGMNGIVRALEVFDDGSGGGPALYAAGQFSVAGSTEASFLAKWDGETWTAVGDGTNGWIYALEVFDDGGGGGPALFVGGNFMSAGGVDASRVARWDGTAWSSVGGAAPDGPVYALLAVDAPQLGGPALFMSGFFHDLGVIPANFVARWNGAGWSALGTGTNDWIWALEVFDDGSGSGPSLIAGGYFIFAGGMSAARIAKWNGAEWSTLGSGIAGVAAPRIFSLKVFDDEGGAGPALYAGGIFATAGGVPAANIAKWNGSEWSALGDGVSGGAAPGVQALVVSNDGAALIAGGSFPASPALDSFVARWQGCAEPPCAPADLNCDGFVDGDDLGTLLGQWGECAGCAADFNGDGVVDGDDLGELLGEWTPIG